MEAVVALLMFVNFEIKEHRIQDNMALCLRRKREAERTYSPSVTYKCLKTKAEIEINNDGSKSIKKIILK
jgi:membrane-bound inhibitor of C-type lysozyme